MVRELWVDRVFIFAFLFFPPTKLLHSFSSCFLPPSTVVCRETLLSRHLMSGDQREVCRTFRKKGRCRYGDECIHLHTTAATAARGGGGGGPKTPKQQHGREVCRTFRKKGRCRYGDECIHLHGTGGGGASDGGDRGRRRRHRGQYNHPPPPPYGRYDPASSPITMEVLGPQGQVALGPQEDNGRRELGVRLNPNTQYKLRITNNSQSRVAAMAWIDGRKVRARVCLVPVCLHVRLRLYVCVCLCVPGSAHAWCDDMCVPCIQHTLAA